MGKDSLIKSTAKKGTKKEEEVKKTTTKKKAAKKETSKKNAKAAAKTKKTAVKKKSPSKAAPKKKTTATKTKPKKTAKPKTKTAAKRKTAAKKTTKKLTGKALLLKSFDPISKIDKPKPATTSKQSWPSAPPIINASDSKERARLRKLLFQTFDMAAIKAAANTEVHAQPIEEAVKESAPRTAGAAQPPSIPSGISNTPPEPDSEGFSNPVKLLATCVGVVILLLMMTSYSNSSKFYIEPKDNAIEIWKGRFSPKDKRFYMVLHGSQLLGKAKEVYTREDVFPMIFEYYLGKADTLLEVPGLPDFEGIKTYLHDARTYATSNDKRKRIADRINNIDRMILLYKADVSISQGSLKSLDAAIKHLTIADRLTTNATQEQEIQQKIDLANSLKAALKAKEDKKTK